MADAILGRKHLTLGQKPHGAGFQGLLEAVRADVGDRLD